MKRVRRRSPRQDLARAMRVAANQIADPAGRRIAANHAAAIPLTYPERFRKGWGVIASMGRTILRSLPDLPADQQEVVAANLRQCADIVQHGDIVVSETTLGGRRERRA